MSYNYRLFTWHLIHYQCFPKWDYTQQVTVWRCSPGYTVVSAFIHFQPDLVSVSQWDSWRLKVFRVSDQWFGKSCHIFKLSLHLKWVMPTSLPALIVDIQHGIDSTCISYLSTVGYPLTDRLHFRTTHAYFFSFDPKIANSKNVMDIKNGSYCL